MNSCNASTVESKKDILIKGATHPGVVTHVCVLENNHKEEYCECLCGKQWKKFGKY